jgi:DNA-binding HxlR family transcriptional regulator
LASVDKKNYLQLDYRRATGLVLVEPADLFEAISHPERIKILKILQKQPSSFASLKRQLGIDSSGNLDFHLKKLGKLVTVREDGMYGLTDAGKEALLSIDAGEIWAEMERRKIKTLRKMPKEAFALGLLEIGTTALIFLFFLELMQLSFSWDSLWGFIFFGALLLTGYCSGVGVFLRWRSSWTMVLAKSALIMSMSLFLLDYVWAKPGAVQQSSSMALSYLAFVAAETAAIILALRQPLKDHLGTGNGAKLPRRAFIGSLLCISGGILLILLENADRFLLRPSALKDQLLPDHVSTVFVSMSDTSILCGLLIIVGGVLILLRSRRLGVAISIIFGLFPTPFYLPPWLPQQITFHALDLIWGIDRSSACLFLIGAVVDALPVVGGLLAYSARRIRT